MKKISLKAQCPANPAGFHKDILRDGEYWCVCCGISRGKHASLSVQKGLNVKL